MAKTVIFWKKGKRKKKEKKYCIWVQNNEFCKYIYFESIFTNTFLSRNSEIVLSCKMYSNNLHLLLKKKKNVHSVMTELLYLSELFR